MPEASSPSDKSFRQPNWRAPTASTPSGFIRQWLIHVCTEYNWCSVAVAYFWFCSRKHFWSFQFRKRSAQSLRAAWMGLVAWIGSAACSCAIFNTSTVPSYLYILLLFACLLFQLGNELVSCPPSRPNSEKLVLYILVHDYRCNRLSKPHAEPESGVNLLIYCRMKLLTCLMMLLQVTDEQDWNTLSCGYLKHGDFEGMVQINEIQSDCFRSVGKRFRVLWNYGTGPSLSRLTSVCLSKCERNGGFSPYTGHAIEAGLGRSIWTHNQSQLGG